MKSNILLVDKPEGMLSRKCMLRVCSEIKKKGIEGILDPFASGLLIIATNHATRYLSYFHSLRKTYRVKLSLGVLTDTLDHTGEITRKENQLPAVSEEKIKKVFRSLTGNIQLLPPDFSNVKINGVSARKIARRGESVDLKPRAADVFSLELLDFDSTHIHFLAEVGKGVYIRSLGLEIAERLGTLGHLSYLRRIQIGKFDIDHIDWNLSPSSGGDGHDGSESIKIKTLSIQEALYWMDELALSPEYILRLQQGQKIKYGAQKTQGIHKIMDIQNEFYGFADIQNEFLIPYKMLPLISKKLKNHKRPSEAPHHPF